MKIVYASTGADLDKIKKTGFDTVCGYFTNTELDKMLELGLQCIYGAGVPPLSEHPAICAYYVYDEPDLNKISLIEQDATIQKYRRATLKPLAIACVENTTRLCSPNFDWYMLDIYYLTEIGRFKKLINYLNVAFSTFFIKVLYRGKKVLPIVGIFHDDIDFHYTTERYPFAKKFLSYFRGEDDFAVFLWAGYGPNTAGIIDREDYYYDAWCLNHCDKHKKCWWITDRLLTMTAYVVIWVRSIIPDKWIDKMKGWFGIR